MRSLLLLMLFPLFSYGQRYHVDTVYFDLVWQQTTKDKAVYFRPPPQKEGKRYRVKDYYKNGQLQAEVYFLPITLTILDGPAVYYSENGWVTRRGHFSKGKPVGEHTYYYKDSEKVHAVETYLKRRKDTTVQLVSYYKDGSVKRKQWTVNDSTVGKCYDSARKEIPFTPFIILPKFKGDLTYYLVSSLKYPEYARLVSQQGNVKVRFAVDETGKVVEIAADHKYQALAKEAYRVIAAMPDWEPGLIDGTIEKIHMMQPVMFQLK